MTRRLTERESELLSEVVTNHAPELQEALNRFPASLSRPERDTFQMAISDEFLATGLLPDSEPNERGLLLEGLLDLLLPYIDGRAGNV